MCNVPMLLDLVAFLPYDSGKSNHLWTQWAYEDRQLGEGVPTQVLFSATV